MTSSDPQDDTVTPAGASTGFKYAAYGDAPKAGWEISSNPLKRALTYIGLYNLRDLTIAVASAALAVVVTLGLQAVFGNDKPVETGISQQVNYGSVDPDSAFELDFADCGDASYYDAFCNPRWEPWPAPSPTMVTLFVSPEIYKKIPADMQATPFCGGDALITVIESCDSAKHVDVLKGLLTERQFNYLFLDLGVSVHFDYWTIVQENDWANLDALPGDITGLYGPYSTLEQVEVYLK